MAIESEGESEGGVERGATSGADPAAAQRARRRRYWYALLALPFIGTLWVPFYNQLEPRAGAIPFFYWYQFLWIGISAVLTAVVYFATRDDVR